MDLKVYETKNVLTLGPQNVSTSYKCICCYLENLIKSVYVGKVKGNRNET
jgi:hypothetical protein